MNAQAIMQPTPPPNIGQIPKFCSFNSYFTINCNIYYVKYDTIWVIEGVFKNMYVANTIAQVVAKCSRAM